MKRRLPGVGRSAADRGAPSRPADGGDGTGPSPSDPPRPATASGGVDPETVREALRSVIDPEVGLDIVTMGLVYGVEVDGGEVAVTFTLTTPGCPLAAVIRDAVESAVAGVPGVGRVRAELVWEPRWNPDMIEEGAW